MRKLLPMALVLSIVAAASALACRWEVAPRSALALEHGEDRAVLGGQYGICYDNPPVAPTTCPANALAGTLCSTTQCKGGPNMRTCPSGTTAAGAHIGQAYFTYCSTPANGALNCGYTGTYCNYTKNCSGCNVDAVNPNIYWCDDGTTQTGQGAYIYMASPSGGNCFGGSASVQPSTDHPFALALAENGSSFRLFTRNSR